MRRIDKKLNMMKANIIAESNYLKSKGLINESIDELNEKPININEFDVVHVPLKGNEAMETFKNGLHELLYGMNPMGYINREHVYQKKISPKQINARINNVIKLLNYYADRIKDGLLDYNNDSEEYDNNWGSYEQNDTEGINEIFGFGGFKKESVYPYIEQLKELLLPSGPLTIKMAQNAPNSINKCNQIFDAIKADKNIVKKMEKKGLSLKTTLGVDEYGMNRASDKYKSDMNNLYLGNVGGLNTKTLEFWTRNIDDAEVANTIGKQLSGWVNSNINHVIEVLTSLTKD